MATLKVKPPANVVTLTGTNKVVYTVDSQGFAYIPDTQQSYFTSKGWVVVTDVASAPGVGLQIPPITKSAITANRSTSALDDQTIAGNNTSSNYTITVAANTIPNGMILQQLSTGTVTVEDGDGVTFVGATLATSSAGQQIVINPTPIANTFNVKVA